MINYQGQITIEQVLSEIRANPDRTFLLHFCRATGKQRGTVKVVPKCRVAKPKEHYRRPGPQPIKRGYVKRSLMVDRGQIGLENAETGEYLTPLMSHFMAYNLKKIIHS